MPFSIPCPACDTDFALSEDLFQERVVGKVVRFQCPSCGEPTSIDAMAEAALQPLAEDDEVPERQLKSSDFLGDVEPGGRDATAAEAESTPPQSEPAPVSEEIDELSDDEVASVSPESLAALNAGRPPPRPKLESKLGDELWVVSVKEGAEDQEIFESSLVEQIREGSMPGDAIVWREGMKDWLPLADVSELSQHLPAPADKTGGFLGTGMSVSFGSNAGERKSTPPPLPPKKRSYGGKKSSHGKSGTKPVALSPGLLFSVDDAKSEPPVALPTQGSKPTRQAPRPPLKAPRRAVTRDLDFSDIAEDEEPLSSGTPALSDLTASIRKENEKPADMFASLGGTDEEVLAPPRLELGEIARPAQPRPPLKKKAVVEPVVEAEAPPESKGSDSAPESEVSPSKRRKKSKKRKQKSATARSSKQPPSEEVEAPKSGKSRRPKPARASEPSPAKTEEERAPLVTPLRVVFFAAVAVAAYLLVSRQQAMDPKTDEPAPVVATGEPQRSVEASKQEDRPAAPKASAENEPVEPAEPSAGEPEAEAKTPPTTQPGPAPAAAAVKAPTQQAPAEVESPTPTKPTLVEPEKPAEEKPKPKPPAPSNENLPPFDKAAAVGALNTAVGQAAGCRQPGDPSGTARVVITFAPSGRVTSANLSGPPFAGTRTGGCIASTMRRARVPAFSGTHVTVAKSVVIR